ncbi:MAG TPA: radical SAM protein [Bacteroidia bacterium]|nr:radical SAM protein [Bacteroidia bacterium]
MKPTVLLFNPRAARAKPRLPNSILSVAASVDGKFPWVIVDGNMETDPWPRLLEVLQSGSVRYFGCTVMPGPQLKQAIPFTRRIRELFPEVIIIWGGYFPSNQYSVVLDSGLVDVVVNGPGNHAFPAILDAIENRNSHPETIGNIIYRTGRFPGENKNKETIPETTAADGNRFVITKKDDLYDQDELPVLPYEKLNEFYPIQKYLGKTYLGTKTIAYHSSIGCPFTCSFCAVVPIYEARWKGKSAEHIYRDIKFLKENYGGNAIEFHDNNFFVSEKRTVAFSSLIQPEKMIWWGEGRIDTIDKYSDDSLAKMRASGCKMIFFGAETGNDAVLKSMDKGGTQTGLQIRKFASRIRQFDIIPEYSFVLGFPADTEKKVWDQIHEDISFIREIKEINPATEIIIYLYSPVPTPGSEMYNSVLASGFRFPQTLDEWISPHWENFDLRKNPLTPWLTAEMIDYIRNFETVLNGFYPTVSDIRLSPVQSRLMRTISSFRYKRKLYGYPFEIKALQKMWKYRQPEVEGF